MPAAGCASYPANIREIASARYGTDRGLLRTLASTAYFKRFFESGTGSQRRSGAGH